MTDHTIQPLKEPSAKISKNVDTTKSKTKTKLSEKTASDVAVKKTKVRASKKLIAESTSKANISAEQRLQIIAETAYFKAMSRGFSEGSDVTDWLEAEQEVDQRLKSSAIA